MGILDLILELKTFIIDSLPEDESNDPCESVKTFHSTSLYICMNACITVLRSHDVSN